MLGDEERRVLGEVLELRRRLQYLVGEPRRWTGALRKVAFAEAVRSSNSIEGYTVTLEQAVAATEGGESATPVDEETWRAVIGYRDAMTYVLQLAEDPEVALGTPTCSARCTS